MDFSYCSLYFSRPEQQKDKKLNNLKVGCTLIKKKVHKDEFILQLYDAYKLEMKLSSLVFC